VETAINAASEAGCAVLGYGGEEKKSAPFGMLVEFTYIQETSLLFYGIVG
jgi:hypothetical protein